MRTYKTIQNFLESHEDNNALHTFDDGVPDSESEFLFKVEGEAEVFCLLTTDIDICVGDFEGACDYITANGGVVHECAEWHNGSQDKSGYIVYQHPCEVFRGSVDGTFYNYPE